MSSILRKDGTDLIIKDGGFDYIVEGSGLKKITAPAVAATGGGTGAAAVTEAVKLEDTQRILKRAVQNLEGNAPSADVLAMLKDNAVASAFTDNLKDKNIVGRAEDIFKASKIADQIKTEAANLVPTGTTTAVADVDKKLRSLIARNPKALDLLEDSVHVQLEHMDKTKLAKVQRAYDALKHAAENHPEKIKDVLLKHRSINAAGDVEDFGKEAVEAFRAGEKHSILREIDKAMGGTVGLAGMPAHLDTKVSERIGDIKTKLGAHKDATIELSKLERKKGAKPADVDAAREAVQKLEKDLLKEMDGKVGKEAVKEMRKADKTVFDHVKQDSQAISEHLEALKKSAPEAGAASKGASAVAKSSAWWEKDIKVLEDLAKKEGKATYKELGTITRMNTGSKVLALGTVAAAVYAAVGNKGKAAEMNQQQQQAALENQTSMGRA